MKKLVILFSILSLCWTFACPMDSHSSSAPSTNDHARKLVSEIKTLYSSFNLRTNEEIKQFLTLLELRTHVLEKLFEEACAHNTAADVSLMLDPTNQKSYTPLKSPRFEERKVICQNATKKAYIDAETRYSEAYSSVQRALTLLEKELQKIIALIPDQQASTQITYSTVQPILNARYLTSEAYYKYLRTNGISDTGKIQDFSALYVLNKAYTAYKMQLRICYDHFYKKLNDATLPLSSPFAFDDEVADKKNLGAIVHIIHQAMLCNAITELSLLVEEKSNPSASILAQEKAIFAAYALTQFSEKQITDQIKTDQTATINLTTTDVGNIKNKLRLRALAEQNRAKKIIQFLEPLKQGALQKTELIHEIEQLQELSQPAKNQLIRIINIDSYYALSLYYTKICFLHDGSFDLKEAFNIVVIFNNSAQSNQYLSTFLKPILNKSSVPPSKQLTSQEETKSIATILGEMGIKDKKTKQNIQKKKTQKKKKTTISAVIEKKDAASLTQCHEQSSTSTSSSSSSNTSTISQPATPSLSTTTKTSEELIEDDNEEILVKVLTEPNIQAVSSSSSTISPSSNTPILPALLDGLPTYVEGSDIALTCTKNKTTVGCVIDLERGIDGGYQNKIFIYPSSDSNQSNILANLNYAVTVTCKGHYLTDNNHAFSRFVEKYFGNYGTIQSQTELSEQDPHFNNGYRYKQEIRIPGTITSLVYPTTRIFWKIDHHQDPVNGIFEFTILRKKLDDQKEQPLCIHRFFKPLR